MGALERAKQAYGTGAYDDATIEVLFPEVKESEDDRIRKFLIDFVELENGVNLSPDDAERCIAYLEKQKEQKPNVEYVYPKFRVGDEIVEVSPNGSCPPVIIKYIGEGNYNCESKDRKRFLSFPIKQENEYRLIEQKPAEWKPQPESLEALMYAIEGKWEMIKPTSYLSRMLEDLYEGLVSTYNVDDSLLAELPKTAYTAEDIEELRTLKAKIEASMEDPIIKPVK